MKRFNLGYIFLAALLFLGVTPAFSQGSQEPDKTATPQVAAQTSEPAKAAPKQAPSQAQETAQVAPQTQAAPIPAPQAPAVQEPVKALTPPAAPAPSEATQQKELYIYGEVQAVNIAANSMTVQYYDYDSDEEKTSELVLDNNTKIENAATLADIKKGDWVDVTYIVMGGKNQVKSVIVEKEEAAPMDKTAGGDTAETKDTASEE